MSTMVVSAVECGVRGVRAGEARSRAQARSAGCTANV